MCTDKDRQRIRYPPGGGVRTIGLKRPKTAVSESSAVTGASAAGASVASFVAGAPQGGAAEQAGAVRRANRPGMCWRLKWKCKMARLGAVGGSADSEGEGVDNAEHVPSTGDIPQPSPPESQDGHQDAGDDAMDVSDSFDAGPDTDASAATGHDTGEQTNAVHDDSDSADTDHTVAEPPPGHHAAVDSTGIEDDPQPTVRLIHDDDFTVCQCSGWHCPRGTHAYCSECHRTSYESPCVHLREYADELDFDC